MNIQLPSVNLKPFQSKPALKRSRIEEGRPYPLGATWDGLGVNFAIFSSHATKVELCIFDQEGQTSTLR